ncbi:MAG: hypothetical protein HKM95_00340 [Inquilinus sp.]|nr:hypothetical protein [Inquilinus sp.]
MPRPPTAASARPAPAAWAALTGELDAWAAAGRRATFWWRDDDAVEPGPALDRLLALSAKHAAPLALAVIPAGSGAALSERLCGEPPQVSVLQHGWAHRSHAPATEKKQELGGHRPVAAVLDELDTGRGRLETLFGSRFRPVLVPPWNRIAPAIALRIGEAGLAGLSTFGPRSAGADATLNTHVDIVDWRGSRGFVGAAACLTAARRHLADRRAGRVDADEPTGLLTHHLDHDEACWDFVDAFLTATRAHPGAVWPAPEALFAGAGR